MCYIIQAPHIIDNRMHFLHFWHFQLSVVSTVRSDEKLVPVEPYVDPGVDQAVEGHQPEEGLHLHAYLGAYMRGAKGGKQLPHYEGGGTQDVAGDDHQRKLHRLDLCTG